MKYLKIYIKLQLLALYLILMFAIMLGGVCLGSVLFDVLGGYISILFTTPIVIALSSFVGDKLLG